MSNQIDQIVSNLKNRGESNEYIIFYLKLIINGLQEMAPSKVSNYLDITLHNQERLEESTYAHS
jgi:hypothetical protein